MFFAPHAQTQRNIHDETTYIPPWLKSLGWDEFLYPTAATTQGMRQKLVRFGTRPLEEVTLKKAGSHKQLPAKNL